MLGRAITLPAWPGFGLSLVALLFYFLSAEGGAFVRLNLVLSGMLTGLVLLYRVNFGGYVALVIASDLVIEWTIDRAHRWKELLFKVATFVVPMLACVSILCLRIYGNRLVDGISDFTITSQRIMIYRFIDLKSGRFNWPARCSFRLSGPLCACCRAAASCPGDFCPPSGSASAH